MIRFYLFVYAVIVFALWWCGPMIPDGWMQDTYCYARLALHICGPVWFVKQSRRSTLRKLATGLGIDQDNRQSAHAIQGHQQTYL